MADRRLAVCEPLCYIRSRFGKSTEKDLKDIVLNFYSIDQLIIAKNRLADDLAALNPDGWTHPVCHRDLPGRAQKEVDDIFNMVTFADQLLILDSLPIYVTEDVERIPSMKWTDCEFMMLIGKLNKVESDSEGNKQLLRDLIAANHELSQKLNELSSMTDLLRGRLATFTSFSDNLCQRVTVDLANFASRIDTIEERTAMPGSLTSYLARSGAPHNMDTVDHTGMLGDHSTHVKQVWADVGSDRVVPATIEI